MINIMLAAIQFVTVDPGHFHAALVQNRTYEGVASDVLVYAPQGNELKSHLSLIEQFNTRAANPTAWKETVYTGADFLDRFTADAAKRPAAENAQKIVVLAGRNNVKPDYYLAGVEAGLNVLSDKPMAITSADYMKLCDAAAIAKEKGLFFGDIMTERNEITTILQRELSRSAGVYGVQDPGTPDDPAVTKVSVHHFCKLVNGKPLRRPGWYYDTKQQGEAIVDVTTHLVDLVQWSLFPEQTLKRSDVKILDARTWNTPISAADYEKSTGLKEWPKFLKGDVDKDNVLQCKANGEFTYTLRGVHAKVSVEWHFMPPAGTGDTHYSLMRGTNAELVIRQGAAQGFKPVLYVKLRKGADLAKTETALNAAIAKIGEKYPGVKAVPANGEEEGATWKIDVPKKYDIGHEAHFSQVMQQFLEWMKSGKMPEMERCNLLVKYYTLAEAWKKSR
jgi:predicted dehydrogenase